MNSKDQMMKTHFSYTEDFVITGILTNGKRFKPIHTKTPQHYNIWKGTIWQLMNNGKRKLIKRIWN
jgi:hypothetical protein